MHFISEELARVRRRELMQEACEQRLVAKVRVSRSVPATVDRFRRPAARRG